MLIFQKPNSFTTTRKIQGLELFEFNEKSFVSIEELKEQGFEFDEIEVFDPLTNEKETLVLPK